MTFPFFWLHITHFYVTDATGYSSAYFGQGNGSVVLDNVACVGNEIRLVDCQYTANDNCSHSEDAGVSCKRECEFSEDSYSRTSKIRTPREIGCL